MATMNNRAKNSAQVKSVFLTNTKTEKNKKEKTAKTEETSVEIQDAVIVEENPVEVQQKKATVQDIEEIKQEIRLPQPIEVPMQVLEKTELSMESIIEKSEKLQKHITRRTNIKDKLKMVDDFKIGHDDENSVLELIDCNNMRIKTSNPVTIGNVLKDWKHCLTIKLEESETEIRELMNS